jgi:hypothetical protein
MNKINLNLKEVQGGYILETETFTNPLFENGAVSLSEQVIQTTEGFSSLRKALARIKELVGPAFK